MLSVSFREKHLLTKTSRSRFHSQMFNHNNKYPRYKETNEQQTNFLTEKVIEHRTLHLYQRYLSFDNLNQISWNYIRSNTVHSRIDVVKSTLKANAMDVETASCGKGRTTFLFALRRFAL